MSKQKNKGPALQLAIVCKADHGDYVQVVCDITISNKGDGICIGELGGEKVYIDSVFTGHPIPVCPDCDLPLVKNPKGWVCGCNAPKKAVAPSQEVMDEMRKRQEETNLACGKGSCSTGACGTPSSPHVQRTKPFNPQAAMADMATQNKENK